MTVFEARAIALKAAARQGGETAVVLNRAAMYEAFLTRPIEEDPEPETRPEPAAQDPAPVESWGFGPAK